MLLNNILKYYVLTVLASVSVPLWVMGTEGNTVKDIAVLTGIIAAANLPRLLLLIKTGFKTRLALVPFATVIPAIALYYIIFDSHRYTPDYITQILASAINSAINIFVLFYAYEKIMSAKHAGKN
ncbi:MAG: hypothetical protein V4581_03255 [Bacteroidota bacterium]